MKKLSFFVLVLFSSFSLGQDTPGNLQFNRIVNYSHVYNNPSDSDLTTFLVPDGKVWKVTSITMVKPTVEICDCAIYIRDADSGEQYGINAYASNQYSDGKNLSSLTFWLNSGTKIMKISALYGGSYNISYSAIEFNIVD